MSKTLLTIKPQTLRFDVVTHIFDLMHLPSFRRQTHWPLYAYCYSPMFILHVAVGLNLALALEVNGIGRIVAVTIASCKQVVVAPLELDA